MQHQATTEDFPSKMSSLGEVQRIIGLSLSKIQLGRNQRGGLPLHKNLLVATMLNKARDLYMQETMYMNYKMMTGQFGAMQAVQQQQVQHQLGQNQSQDDMEEEGDEDEVQQSDNEDYEEDCEDSGDSDEEADGSDSSKSKKGGQAAAAALASAAAVNADLSSVAQQHQEQLQQQQAAVAMYHQQQFLQQQHQMMLAQQHHIMMQQQQQQQQQQVQSGSSDEGFIDEPDCDCDTRNNFGNDAENAEAAEDRAPFQYCYNCAPFHSSNGRGPTLVHTRSPAEGSAVSPAGNPTPVAAPSVTIYDMDSKSTENRSPLPGSSDCAVASLLERPKSALKRRRSSDSCSSVDATQSDLAETSSSPVEDEDEVAVPEKKPREDSCSSQTDQISASSHLKTSFFKTYVINIVFSFRLSSILPFDPRPQRPRHQ